MPKVPSALTELRASLPQSQSSTSSTSSSHIPTPFDMLQERDLVVTKVNKTAERHIERLDIKFESLGMAKAVVIAALWHAAAKIATPETDPTVFGFLDEFILTSDEPPTQSKADETLHHGMSLHEVMAQPIESKEVHPIATAIDQLTTAVQSLADSIKSDVISREEAFWP